MIVVIIGQSGGGKTSFAKTQFLQGELKIVNDIVPYTTNGRICAIGKYGIGKRTEGTDTLSYNCGAKIRQLTAKLNSEGKDILMEGDRINNRAMFEFLRRLGADVKLYLVQSSLEKSIDRLRAAGSNITRKFVKATKTKSRNNFLQWAEYFNGEVITND